MLPVQHAARALGVPDDQLRRLAKQGTIPGAIDRGGEWLIPTMSLVAVAQQQGWTLDLAALQHQLDEHAVSRYSGDVLAAQAALLLAKTQATAARVESRDLLRRLREATATAEADRAARAEVVESLAVLQEELEDARREQAVAEARLAEIQARLSSEDLQFQFMVDRIRSLEQERHRLSRSLGWFGRLRYRRLVERELSRPAVSTGQSSSDDGKVPGADRSAGAPDAPVEPLSSLDPPRPSRPTSDEPTAPEAPAVDLPVWDVAIDDELRGADGIDAPSPPVPASVPFRAPLPPPPVPITGASTIREAPGAGIDPGTDVEDVDDERDSGLAGPPRRRYTQVPRTPDGRFDRSGLRSTRSASPLPTR